MDSAPRHPEARGLAQTIEQRGFSARHPYLAAVFEAGEQSASAARIEVRGDLVEQQDRRRPTPLGDQFGVAEDDVEEQRLLLAGRGARGRLALGDGGLLNTYDAADE